jgi:putative phage-type endonuclease
MIQPWIEDLPEATFLGVHEGEDWHQIRSEGIGGSEVGTICGLNPWESAYTLFHKKTGNIDDSVEPNWAIRFGNAFERPILDLYAEEHPEAELYTTGTFANNEHSWKHANPDALAKVNGEWKIIEVKTARAGFSELPAHYEAQVMWYMHVTGIRKAALVAVAGMTWQEFEIEYDPFMAETYDRTVTQFWKYLQEGFVPDWDGSKSTYETVRKLHPDIEDEDVEIDLESWIELKKAQAEQSKAEAKVNKYKSQILDQMGKARYGWVQNRRVVSRQARGKGTPYLVMGEK